MLTHTNDMWRAHTHTHTHTHMHTHMCTYTRTRAQGHIHAHGHMHACTHTHNLYTRTHAPSLSVCLWLCLSLSLSLDGWVLPSLSVDSWVLPSLSFKRSAKTPHQLASLKVCCVLVEWIMDNTEVQVLQHAQQLLKIQVTGPAPERVGCTDSVVAPQEM